jgi:hypothetical protein
MSLTRSAYALCLGLAVVALGCAGSPTAPVLDDTGTAAKVVSPAHDHHTPLPTDYIKGDVAAVGKMTLWLMPDTSAEVVTDGTRVVITDKTYVVIEGKPAAWWDIGVGFGLYIEGYWVGPGVYQAFYIQASPVIGIPPTK